MFDPDANEHLPGRLSSTAILPPVLGLSGIYFPIETCGDVMPIEDSQATEICRFYSVVYALHRW